ncbi:3712_t:CDS:10, partial [Acaulospora morrowiae]
KSLHERGIKFAAVIILKEQHMEEQMTEERLSNIRKTSGLDTKNCFFVLTPSVHADLPDYVSNIQKALYEHGLNYYREHGKRVKRKKSRLPSPSAVGYVNPSKEHPAAESHPLSVQGWMVRYDYKMATFAEFRQEMNAAIIYYSSCYDHLVDLFAPQSSITPGAPGLPIRNKRWTEARVLADCINLKICKLNMYIDSPSAALVQLNKHVSTFNELYNTLGIGEDTFEYWSWLSKQYRIFGDVLEVATRSGFIIPDPSTVNHHISSNDYRFTSNNSTDNTGVNPSTVLHHPGFYYHLAAKYNSMRRKRFLELEKSLLKIDNLKVPPIIIEAERNLDHSTLTIELLTKSYEQFKKQKTGRMTLYLASQIAETYFEAGKYDMALKFFERIAKTYRKEKWHTVLESILHWSLRCSKEFGTYDNVIEYYIELLSDQFQMSEQKRVEIQKELMDVIYKSELSNSISPRHVVIDMNEINSFLNCHVQYKDFETFVGTPTYFQVIFSSPPSTPPLPLRFTFLRFSFNDSYFNYYLDDNGQDEIVDGNLQWIDCKDCSREEREGEGHVWIKKTNLSVLRGTTKVFEGLLVPKECGELTLQLVTLGFVTANWKIEFRFDVNSFRDEILKRKWLKLDDASGEQVSKPKFVNLEGNGEFNSIKVTQKQAKLEIKAKHLAPALLDEYYPIELTINNMESEDIKAIFHVGLFSDINDSEDRVVLDYNSSDTIHLKDIDLGVIIANGSLVKTIYILGKKHAGARVLNLVIWYSFVSSIPQASPPTQDWIEKRKDIRLSFVSPFSVTFSISLLGQEFGQDNVVNIKSSRERIERHLLVAKISSIGPWDIVVSAIDLIMLDQANAQTKIEVIASSTELDSESLEQLWRPGYIFNVNYFLELKILDENVLDQSVDIGLLDIQWKRKQSIEHVDAPFTETTTMVPQLQRHESDLSAIIEIPPNPVVGKIFTLTYKITNWSSAPIEIYVTVEVNDAFVFSGYKQTHFSVDSFSTYFFKVNCFPLIPGKIRLPRAKMAQIREPGKVGQEISIVAPGYKEPHEDD